jgi:hypothetical protein
MFISNYATYIPTQKINKIVSKKEESTLPAQQNFQLDKLEQEGDLKKSVTQKQESPNSFKYSFLNNSPQSVTDYKKLKTDQEAKKAYEDNSNKFSFMGLSKPKPTIGKTPTPQTELSKIKGINTYIENENYYRATAA